MCSVPRWSKFLLQGQHRLILDQFSGETSAIPTKRAKQIGVYVRGRSDQRARIDKFWDASDYLMCTLSPPATLLITF